LSCYGAWRGPAGLLVFRGERPAHCATALRKNADWRGPSREILRG